MKTNILLFLTIIIFQFSFGQSNRELVEQTVQNYINGSSYNRADLLESAFTENATLYLTINNEFQIISPQKYVSWFKGTPGEFTGRVGTILSIEVENEDIATAKAEILIPERGWRFIDLFLLKNTSNGWKIISKTATKQDDEKKGDKILFVVSNAHFYGNTDLNTGNSFSEIVHAYATFKNAGYNVDMVSPEGGAIPIAYLNTSEEMSKKHLYDEDFMYAIKHTQKPSQIDPSQYKAIQFIGGGSAMFGVPENKEIQRIAMQIYERHNGIVSAVCHGTAGIVNLKTQDGNYLVKGKRVSGYPDSYEAKDRDYYKTFPFPITQTIENRGGLFKFSPRNVPHVEVDGRLVTGQNWVSSTPIAEKIIELLQK